MRQQGFSLLEALVALALTTVVLLAVGSFYTQTGRAWWQGQDQADLRRLTGLVRQEMGRIIGPAVGLPAGSCGPEGASASLPVQLPAGVLEDPQFAQGGFVCFFRDPATDQLVRCKIESLVATTCMPNTEANLLTGSPITDPVRLTDRDGEPGSGLVFSRAQAGGAWVDVSLNVGVFGPDGINVGPVSFSTRFAVRN